MKKFEVSFEGKIAIEAPSEDFAKYSMEGFMAHTMGLKGIKILAVKRVF